MRSSTAGRPEGMRGLLGRVAIVAAAVLAVWLLDAEARTALVASLRSGTLAELLTRPEFWGVEYGYIGFHLAEGRGFAGPYLDDPRPTAIMPPGLPLLFGAVFALAGYQTLAAFLLLEGLRIGVLAVGWLGLERAAERLGLVRGRGRLLLRVTILLGVAVFAPRRLLFLRYDEWLLWGAVATALWLGLTVCRARPARASVLGWGGVLGALVLIQPIVAFAFGAATVAVALDRQRRALWLALPVAFLILSPWLVRNARVFGNPLPVKSTLFFELYYGTLIEPDGIHREEEVMHGGHHPFFAGPERERALELGEEAYFAEKRERFLQSLREDPGLYASKVGSRLLYATVRFPDSQAHQVYFNPWVPAVVKYGLYPLPFLAFALAVRRSRASREMRFLAVAYAAFLLPYVIINFWLRYWVQVLPLHILLVAWGAMHVSGPRQKAAPRADNSW